MRSRHLTITVIVFVVTHWPADVITDTETMPIVMVIYAYQHASKAALMRHKSMI